MPRRLGCGIPVIVMLLLPTESAVFADGPGELVPPPINQPASFRTFGRPIGMKFDASWEAQPTTLRLDSSLTLTIRVEYQSVRGELPQRAPKAPILGDEFTSLFRAGEMTTEGTGRSWKFTCQLTPLSDKVSRLPALLFTYYSPLQYQTVALPSIDITVLPRETVATEEGNKPGTSAVGTTPVSRFANGVRLLARDDRWALPPTAVTVLLLLGPPAACLMAYRLWRQLYPDEVLRLRRRRSRAARAALRGLDLARAARSDIRANLAASIIANYLKERLDLSITEPTPRETADHLEKMGCTKECVQQATEFFDVCDSARFAADAGIGREHLIGLAEDLVLSLEKGAMA